MNVIQANTSPQTSVQQESGSQDADMNIKREFEGHLSTAKQHVEWFTDEKIGSEKKRIIKEQIERKRNKNEKEDEVIEEFASSSLKNEDKMDISLQETSHSRLQVSENKVQNAQIKKNTNHDIGQKKVDQKNVHFVQPAAEMENASETGDDFSKVLTNHKEAHQQTPSTLSSLNLSGETVSADQQKKLDLTNRGSNIQNSIENKLDSTRIQGLKDKSDQSSIQNRSAFQKQNKAEFSQAGKTTEKAQVHKGVGFSNEIQQASGKENQDNNLKAENKDLSKAEKANIKEITGNLRIMLSAKKDVMTVNLAPEHLGKLEIKLKKMGDKMSGVFKVENKEAEEMLKSQFSQLRESLEEQGIKIDEFTVIGAVRGEQATT